MAETPPETKSTTASPEVQPDCLGESKLNHKSGNDHDSKEDAVTDADRPTPSRKKDARIFKIIVIGDSNCGKTCLTYRFCEGKFSKRVEATIGVDFREKVIEINGDLLKLQLWDTAGQERFRRSMVPHYYRNVHAVVYVYDVTKRSSFDGLYDWLSEFQQHASNNPDVPRIVVGNKVDLEHLRQVQTGEAQLFADKFNMPHFETSAKDDDKTDHTEAIFMTLAHKLKARKTMMGKRYSSASQDHLTTRPVIQRYTTIGQESKSSCC